MRFRILQKGLAFLILPLALQVVFFGQLYDLSCKADEMSKLAYKLSDRIYLFDALLKEIFDGWGEIAGTVVNHHAPPFDADTFHQRLTKALEDCRPLCIGDAHAERMYKVAEALSDHVYAQFKTTVSPGHSQQTTLATFFNGVSYFKDTMAELLPDLQLLNAAAKKDREEFLHTRLQAEEYRKKIAAQVSFGVFADVVIAVALLAWFLRDISQRLSLLVNNARLIPSGQPLAQHVAGNDELAYLDGVLHDVSAALRTAAAHRKSLMEMVAHDLRSPLMSAKLALDTFAIRGTADTEEARVSRIASVRQNLSRLISLVEDLLAVDKLEAGKLELHRELFDATKVVNEAFASMESLAQNKQLTLNNAVSSAVVIEVDKSRILQVLHNLISNAIKYSPNGTTISVTSEVRPQEVEFAVCDQGPGVPADKQAGLFSKFYQVSQADSVRGFGLGLAISKLIVEAHGGQIGIDSNYTSGSRFWFTIPSDVDLTESEELISDSST
jgi:signal transduction histidine kinase